MPRGEPEVASMSHFVDFVLTTGMPKVTVLSDSKRHRDSRVTDFYWSLRGTIVDVHQHSRDPREAFDLLMLHTGDERAMRIFPQLIAGHAKFLAAHHELRWFKPMTAALPAGPGLSIAINPELGLVVDGVRHHIKLYLRSEPLGQKRVDFTIALMSLLDVPEGDKFAVLDLRNATLHYMHPKSAGALGWRKLSALVYIEAAGYGAGWARL